jgi:hypothetical protein
MRSASVSARALTTCTKTKSLIYAVFCAITLVWVSLYVPETRGVAVGPAMDRIFGAASAADEDGDEDEVVAVEETETSPLLQREQRRRRGSFASPSHM